MNFPLLDLIDFSIFSDVLLNYIYVSFTQCYLLTKIFTNLKVYYVFPLNIFLISCYVYVFVHITSLSYN